MTAILAFLEKGILPLGKKEAQKVIYRASSYTIINGRLCRRSASSPLLHYLDTEEQKLALETVHEGICGEHLAIRADAHQYTKKCRQYQLFSLISKQPSEEMTSVLSLIRLPCGR
ncbi:uncharacterized protein LOC141679368 [Apium graveolens]|uniref:uncharacterized protein LOC141679368 n=1 Tax=Apium graveolens TaxID=4045 RepID=UPI003D791247